MMRLLKILLNAMFVLCCTLVLLIPRSKYDWLQDIDPSVATNRFEDVSGNRWITVAILLLLAIAAQLILLLKAKTKLEKTLALAFIVIACAIAFFKFA